MKKTDLLKSLKGLGEVFDKPISDDLLTIWQSTLGDLTDGEFTQAIQKYVLDPESKFFPKPGQIYGLARPKTDPEQDATLMVEQVFTLLGTCGGDAVGVQRAKERLTELSWVYMENMGGWGKFTRDMQLIDNDQLLTAKSQMRKAFMGLIDRKRSGMPLQLSKSDGLSNLSFLKNLQIGISHEDSKTS